jgi:hypothetical protein
MRGNVHEASQVLQSVFESGLTMTPREYAITGRPVLGETLAAGSAPSSDQARGLGVADYSRPQRDALR